MKKCMMRKVYYRCIAMTLLGISVFTGCGTEKAENRTVLRQMGIEYMSKGEYASAIESFESALNQSVGTVGAEELDIVYYKAAAQYASGDANAAMDTYNAILAFDEEAYRAYYLRGCLYCKQSNIESAKADFAAAKGCKLSAMPLTATKCRGAISIAISGISIYSKIPGT